MKITGILDKRVLDKILNPRKFSRVSIKLQDFLITCNEVLTYEGNWEKDKNSENFFRILESSGKRFRKINPSAVFSEILKDTDHFTLSITSDDSRSFNSSTPVLSLDRLKSLIEYNHQTAFYIKNMDDFSKASLLHEPTAVILNDRYFFNDENPSETLILLLKNILPDDYCNSIVITIFCSLPEKQMKLNQAFLSLIEIQKPILEKNISKVFHNISFQLEFIECRHHNITHDRFLFTDLLCYKSESSFHFIPENNRSTINRFPLYEGANFKANVDFLTDYLKNADQTTLKKSKNPIIKSYLGKMEAKSEVTNYEKVCRLG